MSRRQEIWRRYEREWLRKHAVTKRFECIFKADDEDGTDDDMTKHERTLNMTFPIHKVAKSIAETGTSWLTEQQLTEKIFEHAQTDRRSGETPEQAFARHFAADDEQGRTFRKAVQSARAGSHHPFPR
jgi:hypothetical protein